MNDIKEFINSLSSKDIEEIEDICLSIHNYRWNDDSIHQKDCSKGTWQLQELIDLIKDEKGIE